MRRKRRTREVGVFLALEFDFMVLCFMDVMQSSMLFVSRCRFMTFDHQVGGVSIDIGIHSADMGHG